MEDIEVRFDTKYPLETLLVAAAYTELNGKKSIYINKALKEAPFGCLNAIKEHEKVHLKGRYFLFDDFESIENKESVLLAYAKNYHFKELEEKLKDPKNNRRPIKKFNTENEVAREISHINHHTANLIAYYETNDEETKNWIMFLDGIKEDDDMRKEILDFIIEKPLGKLSNSRQKQPNFT
jgi:hypothetical protein